jgi:organic hydroperoxide reductase OsmC/OhrA
MMMGTGRIWDGDLLWLGQIVPLDTGRGIVLLAKPPVGGQFFRRVCGMNIVIFRGREIFVPSPLLPEESKMAIRSKEYKYQVTAQWMSERKGVLKVEGKQDLPVATPLEFKGHPGIWSPEDMFVGALVSCFMTTFLGTAYHRELDFKGFEATAEGTLARPAGEFLFTLLTIQAKVTLPKGGDRDLADEVLEFAKEDCLVSHSIVSEVKLESTILEEKEEVAVS